MTPSHQRNIHMQNIMRSMKRTIPTAKIWNEPATAPRDTNVELLLEDGCGRYPVPSPCRLTDQGFVNSRTGTLIRPRVVGLRMRGW